MPDKYCQSCGMPLGDAEALYGTQADGSRSADYCQYCYQNGQFTAACTMEEMIEFCVPHMLQANPGMEEAQARSIMQQCFPALKRWKRG